MLADALSSLENLSFIAALRESTLAYPLVNALHILGIALLFGAIVPLDLRLAGWKAGTAAVDSLASFLIPTAIAGFLIAACAGLLLFATDARAYADSPFFQAKLAVIGAALLNALWLRRIDWRGAAPSHSRLALAGVASILLWSAAIVLGRLIGYF